MIRHLVQASRRPPSRNILSVFTGSQYGGQTFQPTPRQPAVPSNDLDLVNMAANSLSISNREKVYKLPEHLQKTAVLDPNPFSRLELPSGMIIPKTQPENPRQNTEITAPSAQQIEKSCKSDLKQRRRHMNKHKLKKLRKRMKFVYMKLEQKKARRKALELQKDCDDIVNAAKAWDPLAEIKSDLEAARKGGFGIDVFERKSL